MSRQKQTVTTDIAVLLKTYKPSAETVELVRRIPIVLLVGVSGAGKGTIKQKLIETGKYYEFISHTTRPPRENHGVMEQDGVEYHFISLEESKHMLEDGAYIEAKMYGDKVYGTSVAELQKAGAEGKIAINDIEVQGVAEYKAIADTTRAMFIVPPTYEEWRRRLLYRYGDAGADPEDIKKRTFIAIEELEHALEVDYYHFIINDELDRAVQAIDTLVHDKEHFGSKDEWARQKAIELLAVIKKRST